MSTLEHQILRYERKTASRLADGLNVVFMMNGTTEVALQIQLRMNAGGLRLHPDVKNIITNYFQNIHTSQGQASGGAAHMEVATTKEKAMVTREE